MECGASVEVGFHFSDVHSRIPSGSSIVHDVTDKGSFKKAERLG
jgi:hypothetical protein